MKRWLPAALVVLAAALLIILTLRSQREPFPTPDGTTQVERPGSPTTISSETSTSQPPAPATVVEPGTSPSEIRVLPTASELASQLNSPAGSPGQDIEILEEAIAQYRRVFGSSPPGGDNREISAALTGQNTRGLAVLPPDLPGLNENGELVDRWGTPFLFHPVSREVMEVLSAGPDETLWTPDDVGKLTPFNATGAENLDPGSDQSRQ